MKSKKAKQFRPNEKMRRLLEARLNPEVAPTITAECEYAGISRQAYYNWLEDDDFVKWFSEEFEKGMGKAMWWLDKVGLLKATTDFKYWEALQMKYAKYQKRYAVENNLSLNDIEEELQNIKNSLRGKPGDGQTD